MSVYRVGEIDGRPYIISELVRGKNLDSLTKPVPWQRALELGRGLARGLAAAHRCGVLHRDIKPGNAIISSNGDIKLLDLGLAEFVDRGPVSLASHREPRNQISARSKVSGNAETIELLDSVPPGRPTRSLPNVGGAPQLSQASDAT